MKIFVLLLTCLFALSVQAQDENSLLTALAKEKDNSKRGDILYQLGLLYQKKEGYKKAISYYEQALPLVSSKDALGIKQRVVRSYASTQDYKNALTKGDELLNDYSRTQDNVGKIVLLNELSDYAQRNNNYDKALYYNEQLLTAYQNANDLKGQAIAYNNLGVVQRRLGDKGKSTDYFNKAIDTNKEVLKSKSLSVENNAFTHINVGVTYLQLKNYKQANYYFDEGLRIAGSSPKVKASALNYTAMGRYLNDQTNEALTLATEARDLAEANNDSENLLAAYKILSLIYQSQDDYKESQEYNNRYQELTKAMEAKRQEDQKKSLQREIDIEKKESEINNAIAEADRREAAFKQSELERQKQQQELKNREQELRIAKQNQEIAEAKLREQKAEQQRTQQLLEIAQQKAENERQKAETEKQKSEAERQKLLADKERTEKESKDKDLKSKEKDLQYANEQKKLQDAKLQQEAMVRYLGIFLLILVVGVLIFVYRSLTQTKKLNNQIKDQVVLLQEQQEEINVQNEELTQSREELMAQRDELADTNAQLVTKNDIIAREQERSEKLLLNILPVETANELKEKGSATPKHYDLATVLFTDFKGFTNIAEKMTPHEVIEQLNTCFLAFDEICERHNLEKIKTIGDSYMCAGGIPVANVTNPIDAVEAALEMQRWMAKWKADKEAQGLPAWEIRLGIHSGEVIAGVVGKNKFAYDIWGDTVNLASRMESSGEVGKVNVSGTTYELIKHKFHCIHRGAVKAKNKGDVDMYFVEGIL
jgi:class 3 adenylate cyclase/tetratricopeptide (TPR) repeat protein